MNAVRCLLVFVLFMLLPLSTSAQNLAADEQQGMSLYDNLGSYHRTITTSSDLAQQYFDQGVRLAYAFGRSEAVESFRVAQQHDPGCALCYWGEAWALGPYINEPMSPQAGIAAYKAVQKAESLAQDVTEEEQALIKAMAARYSPEAEAERRTALDSAYAEAMRDVVGRFPGDEDAAALYGEALMVLRPWDYWQKNGQPQAGIKETLTVLENVLARDVQHPGACHLYIHLVEASQEPERAEACADGLAETIPGASHIQHMPSHIYVNVGRYGDGVRVNQKAWEVDRQAAQDKAVAIYPTHNMHMLVFAAWMDGQSKVAIEAADSLAKASPGDGFYPLLLRARFGEWDKVLAMEQPSDQAFEQGLWSFGQGLAHLRQDRPDSARVYLERLTDIANKTPDSLVYGFMGHRQADLLKIANGILEAEMAASERRYDEAVEVLEEAVVLEDNLAYDEPEPWPLPIRHVLGAVLLEANRPEDAERVYREDLKDHPHNGWALAGLAQSLEVQGKQEEADKVRTQFEKVWARADVKPPSSRF